MMCWLPARETEGGEGSKGRAHIHTHKPHIYHGVKFLRQLTYCSECDNYSPGSVFCVSAMLPELTEASDV